MAEKECRIAIVDVYPLFREGAVQAILRKKNFIVVGEGTTAEDAERLVLQFNPDVLILEAAVPDSLGAAMAILQRHKTAKVVFLASIADQEHVAQALQAGVHGYIMKGVTGVELVKAIAVVHRGERYITPELAWLLVSKLSSSPYQRDAVRRPLTKREQEVLDCTSRGLSNKEIARMLGLALGTIKYYKTLAFKKLGVRNRIEALASNRMLKH